MLDCIVIRGISDRQIIPWTHMRHTTILFVLVILFPFLGNAIDRELTLEDRRSFIDTYKDLAIKEMHRSGVPASITMAQFIIETDWGRSPLFIDANAGFGIKCKKGWTGETYYKTDDDYDENKKLIESCFRKYPSIEAAFADHSDFLKNRHYYQSLFKLNKYDYRSWSYGLKSCKYATDEEYPVKLINLIEGYRLSLLDYEVAHVGVNTVPTEQNNLELSVPVPNYPNQAPHKTQPIQPETIVPAQRPALVQEAPRVMWYEHNKPAKMKVTHRNNSIYQLFQSRRRPIITN